MASNNKAILKWIISNYADAPNLEKKIFESTFTTIKVKELQIKMNLVLQKEIFTKPKHEEMAHFSFKIEKLWGKKSYKMILSCSVLNSLYEKICTQSRVQIYNGNTYNKLNTIGCMKTSALKNELINGDLILLYQIELVDLSENLEGATTDNFKDHLNKNNEFNDVTLQIKKHKIHANKAILASKSPVFKNMFMANMKESATGNVTVNDIEFETMMEVLRFMYTGRVENLDESLYMKLLAAAHFYQIDDLIAFCEVYLSQIINYENAIKILKLADKLQLPLLKTNSFSFIQLHLSKFQKTPEIADLANNSHAHLLLELVNNVDAS